MPRYFLHIDDGSVLPDLDGSEFTDLAEAEKAVRRTLLEMMVDATLVRRIVSVRIEVRDEAGHLVLGGHVDYALRLMPEVADQAPSRRH